MRDPCRWCSSDPCRCTVDMLKRELDRRVKESIDAQVRDNNMVRIHTALKTRYERLLKDVRHVIDLNNKDDYLFAGSKLKCAVFEAEADETKKEA